MPIIKCPSCGRKFFSIVVYQTSLKCPNCHHEFRSSLSWSFKNSRGTTYYLHGRTRTTASGKQQRIYFFSKTQQEGALDKIPEGYMVSETKSGLPVLKKK